VSDRGVFAVDRGVWDHPMFADEPFTEREAWLWMVSAAAWIAKRVRVGKAMVDLDRGQLAFATRFLAARWKWAHSKVVRFLKRLETDTMVTTLATRESTLITICNYEKYAFGRNATETQTGTQTGTEVKRQRNKEEELNNLRTKDCAKAPRSYDEKFEGAWQAYPRRDGANPKAPAAKRFLAAVKAGTEPQTIIDAVKRYATAEARNVGTPYIPQMVKWLGDQRWLDYDGTQTAAVFNIRSSMI
jgi:hypothetical protein